ncbi:MAG: hemerythrin domain-containing protein [Bacteroidota bacterium]|nr:hemerythrin domain-containing protein [Bacteroidota bacterium]MDP4212966.1 hemerythrin domain-containing protein [Bacteroidota bacterium]MDP4250788.1 hemerythrin domain-containing protein [Bacteroidota bacterium]
MNTGIKPIKRTESLLKLSREHHFTLLFGWKIRQGIKNNTGFERMVPYVHYFWNNHILPHFMEEEEILFAPADDPLVMKAKQQHKAIQQLVESFAVQDSQSTDQLRQLADELDKHIRFEERELFPHLEKILKADQLALIGKKLNASASHEVKDDYADAFWNLKSSL